MSHRLRSGVFAALTAAACLLWAVGPVGAAEPLTDSPNQCANPGGQGAACNNANDCALNDYATVCFQATGGAKTCQIPCEDGKSPAGKQAAICATGETCVQGSALSSQAGASTRVGYYCKPSKFRVDLNLLDQCVTHYLGGIQPTLVNNQCSLEANLNKLLDQNGDKVFDIFDLDLCVLAFLEQPGCDKNGLNCQDTDLTGCKSDANCGDGLYCSTTKNTCQRDCGIIASREESLDELERRCAPAGTTCNFDRGRCDAVDLDKLTCQIDQDCPSGSHCFLGRCALNCYRSVDCPSTDWYCAENNKCRANPHPAANQSFAFIPENYATRFARDELNLDAVQTSDESQMVIIDLLTKGQVVENPSISFGYRLETTYHLKSDSQCLQPFIDCSVPGLRKAGETEAQCNVRQGDCIITDKEEWIRLLTPFGIVTALGTQPLEIELEEAIAAKLTPGTYRATLRILFDNGDSDSITVTYTKASPSGEYTGTMTLNMNAPDALLTGERPLQFGMRLKLTDQQTNWHDLLVAQNVAVEEDIKDITKGFIVNGLLHGSGSLAYANSGAVSTADNEIPFVGLYSPDINRMRLVGIIEIPADFCIAEDGACNDADEDQLKVRNPFGRLIRRRIEFIGPFDDGLGRFHGLYRETISGLAADYDVTVEGGFILDQAVQDESPLTHSKTLLPSGAKEVAYPTDAQIEAKIEEDIEEHCHGWTDVKAKFTSKQNFDAYIKEAYRTGDPDADNVFGRSTIFPDLLSFESNIEEALSTLGDEEGAEQNHLNIYEFLQNRIEPCDEDDPDPPPTCVNEPMVRCGLALHQKAVVKGWIDMDSVKFVPPEEDFTAKTSCPDGQTLDGGQCFCLSECECPEGQAKDSQARCRPLQTGELDLFCVDTFAASGCADNGADEPALLTLQEHNRFWKHLGEALRFSAGAARSDAFLVLYRNELTPFAERAALNFKADKLRFAVKRYDQILEMALGTAAGASLFRWPARAFKSAGHEWIDLIETMLLERMDALAALVDLERRIFLGTGATDFMFAQHMLQHEFLAQVYVMSLQDFWQKELFAWRGDSARLFEKGQSVLNQLNPAKNVIGVTPNKVFFENGNLDQKNWQNYRDILLGDGFSTGLLPEARTVVNTAVDELRASLSDLDSLEEKLRDSKEELLERLNVTCGDPHPEDPTHKVKDYCQYLMKQYVDFDEWEAIRDCKFKSDGAGCDVGGKFTCPDSKNDENLAGSKACAELVQTFTSGTDQVSGDSPDAIANPPTCTFDDNEIMIEVGGKKRPCVGGKLGKLMQELALVNRKRRIVVGSATTLAEQVKAEHIVLLDQDEKADNFESDQKTKANIIVTLRAVAEGLRAAMDVASTAVEAPNCVFIVGFSVGTDCPQKAVVKVLSSVLKGVGHAVAITAQGVAEKMEFDLALAELGLDRQLRNIGLSGDIIVMMREIDGLVDEFNVLTQEAFNLGAEIDHERFLAQEAADRYARDVTFISEHLVGRETGNVLIGRELVAEADNTFRELVDFTYRMTVAFIHAYNVPPAEAATLINKALAASTLDDIDRFVEELSDRERDYCGLEALDCDFDNNVEVLRYSMRDNLFPQLRDIVDAQTGKVITAGQQFHNTITRPPYLHRRIRATLPSDQIELSFSVPLTIKESTVSGEPKWLIDPLSCNQLLDGRDLSFPGKSIGTVAVNVKGKNLDDKEKVIRYEIVRGAQDQLRGCSAESVVEEVGTLPVLQYPIRRHFVGYAPQSVNAQFDDPPSFVTISQPFTACVNSDESYGSVENDACWRHFARDRSLASPDWKLIFPMHVGNAEMENAWLAGDGLQAAQKPVIEDIVLYFRYRSRPINEF